MIIPSGRAVTLAGLCALPALVTAVMAPSYWYAGLFPLVLLISLIIIDAITVAPAHKMATDITVPENGFIGNTVAIGYPRQAGVDVVVETDDRLITGPSPLTFKAVRRGRATISALWLRWSGPFGLTQRIIRTATNKSIAIMPDTRPARTVALQLFQRDMTSGETIQRDKGEGAEFEALAEFRPGMDRRAIDWKHSARHSKLLAKEFRIERNNDVVFAIDSGRVMSDPVEGLPRIDRAVSAAFAAAYTALKLGDKIQLYSFDSRPRIASGPLSGAGNFSLFQSLTADIDYSSEETNFTLGLSMLGSRLNRRSLVLVFTDVSDPASADLVIRAAGRLAKKHLVMFVLMRDTELTTLADCAPDTATDVARAVVAADLLRARQIVLARLQRSGIHIVEAPYDRLGPDLVNAYLGVKRRDLI